jgi:hypothetical protein
VVQDGDAVGYHERFFPIVDHDDDGDPAFEMDALEFKL